MRYILDIQAVSELDKNVESGSSTDSEDGRCMQLRCLL